MAQLDSSMTNQEKKKVFLTEVDWELLEFSYIYIHFMLI